MDERYEIYWLEKGIILADKYEILDVISEGGFGIVYLARDIILGINVAVKEYFPRRFAAREEGGQKLHIYKGVIQEHFESGVDKFLEEARILAQFHQMEGVVTVRDFFYANNTAYIVNEHICGISMREYVEEHGKMQPEKVLEMMNPLIRSLDQIHKEGVLHRDISPDNIILQNDKAVLIDFGAARLNVLWQEEQSMTVFFKRGYSAEEQYIRHGKQGAYTDVYAICATMYFVLTGVRPEESVQRHIRDNVVPLTKYKDIGMSQRQKGAIMKGMSINPANRFQKLSDLYYALYGRHRFSFNVKRSCLIAGGIAILMAGVVLLLQRGIMAGPRVSTTETQATVLLIQTVAQGAIFPDVAASAILQVPAVSSFAAIQAEKIYKVPKVIGRKKKEASQLLKERMNGHLKISWKTVYHSSIEKGCVVSQSIKAGTLFKEDELAAGKKIVIKISKGVKPIPPTPAPTPTPKPARKKEEYEFAGDLPW